MSWKLRVLLVGVLGVGLLTFAVPQARADSGGSGCDTTNDETHCCKCVAGTTCELTTAAGNWNLTCTTTACGGVLCMLVH